MTLRTAPVARCRSLLMVGTDRAGTGGIRAVVCGYIEAGLFDRYPGRYVATHRPGGAGTKLAAALLGWGRVAAALVALDAPLVHVHMASRASFWRKSVVCLLARAARRPYLLHVHGGEFMKFYATESRPAAQRFIRHTLANAALVIALSEQWRDRLLAIAPMARVEVVPNGVPIPDPRELRRPADREPTILFVGDLIRSKGVFDLVRAFARVAERLPDLRLTLAGGVPAAELRELTASLGVQERVRFPGWLGPQRLRAELAGAAVFVLPSYAEGMPMALLEAMSWGLPVIATPVGGVPQVVEHDINGLLVGAGDVAATAAAIARLMSAPALRESLGAAARRTIEARFSLQSALDRLGTVYRRFGLEPRMCGRGLRARQPAGGAPRRETNEAG
jgi:glycosyltransferase involved in cell wall biosynthesis